MLMPLTAAEAEFPARSVQSPFPAWSVHIPLTLWFAPSAESTVGDGGLPAAKPESASEHWNATVTSVLFQPFALAMGVGDPLIVGGVLSILTTTVLIASTFSAK